MESVTIHNYKQPKLVLGVTGAVVAGILGMLGWYWLIRLTNYEIGYAAWGVGVLVGFGARRLAGNGNLSLALAAACCALFAIVGGQFLVVDTAVNKHIGNMAGIAYRERVAFAKRALEAKTDQELRVVVAEDMSEDTKKVAPSDVTAEQLAVFREQDLPGLQDFIKGKPSEAEYKVKFAGLIKGSIPTTTILKESVSPWTALWLVFGIGSAWKIARAEETA